MPWIPNLIFGILAIVAALLGLILPETNNRPLPQTIDDIVSWRHQGKVRPRNLQETRKVRKEEDNAPIEPMPTIQHETYI